jgi:hypothetical protein
VISCSLVLTGCGDDTSKETTNKIGEFDKTRVITDKGVFCNNENGFLKFYDYNSHKSAFLCNKPDCDHTDEKESYAYTNEEIFGVYNDKIYIFDMDFKLSVRNLDGSNYSKLMTYCKKYNSSSDSSALPFNCFAINNKLYVEYYAKVLDSKTGNEKKKAILSCINLEDNTEKIISEKDNSQYGFISILDNYLYFVDYSSNTKDGNITNEYKTDLILKKMNLKDNSISGIYKDKLINFYFFKYFDDTIYFYKNDDPANELYSMSLKNPKPKKTEYVVTYKDKRGNIVHNCKDYKLKLEKNNKITSLPIKNEDLLAGFDGEANKDGFLFLSTKDNIKCKNGTVNEGEYFYMTKDDFYNGKSNYYKVE